MSLFYIFVFLFLTSHERWYVTHPLASVWLTSWRHTIPFNFVELSSDVLYSFPSLEGKRWNLCAFLTEHHTMEEYWGSGGMAERILDLGTKWRWVVSFTPWPLYPQGKSSWYPFYRRLGGPQSRSGRGGEEKNSQPLSGLELPIIQPVPQCYATELIQFVY
jgi:hypothetical protein